MIKKLIFIYCLLLINFMAKASTILVLGDSISAAYGLAIKDGWVNLLQQKLKKNNYNYKVINASISGETTAGGLYRLKDLLKNYKMEILILELGANDGLQGKSLIEMKKNLKKIITEAQQYKIKVVLVGIDLPLNYGQKFVAKFKNVYFELNKELKVSLFIPSILKNFNINDLQNDGLHPKAKAQLKMLNTIWDKLIGILIK